MSRPSTASAVEAGFAVIPLGPVACAVADGAPEGSTPDSAGALGEPESGAEQPASPNTSTAVAARRSVDIHTVRTATHPPAAPMKQPTTTTARASVPTSLSAYTY